MKQWEIRGVTTVADPASDEDGPPSPEGIWSQDRAIRTLVDQLPAVFWTTDGDLTFTSFVGAGVAELGLGPNQVVGMTLGELFEDGDGLTAPLAAHRAALTGRSVRFDMTWVGRTYSCGAAPLRDADGTPIGVICVAIDASPLVSPDGFTVLVPDPLSLTAWQ